MAPGRDMSLVTGSSAPRRYTFGAAFRRGVTAGPLGPRTGSTHWVRPGPVGEQPLAQPDLRSTAVSYWSRLGGSKLGFELGSDASTGARLELRSSVPGTSPHSLDLRPDLR